MKIIFSSSKIEKVPFAYLSFEVERLYAKEFDPEKDMEIAEHCEFITEFVKSCGWTEEEYMFRHFNTVTN
jgi:hypothetical protein